MRAHVELDGAEAYRLVLVPETETEAVALHAFYEQDGRTYRVLPEGPFAPGAAMLVVGVERPTPSIFSPPLPEGLARE